MFPIICVETCPHCDYENTFVNYDAKSNSYKAICKNCGEIIMLCDECLNAHDNESMLCDWHYDVGETVYGKCFRGETVWRRNK